MKHYKGNISIYFVFAILLIMSVVLSVTEMARINCQKLYLQLATDAGLDSMLSLYHRKLYGRRCSPRRPAGVLDRSADESAEQRFSVLLYLLPYLFLFVIST